MTAAEDESRVRAERAQAVALFRYQLVREPADPGLSTRQRGRLVRDLAGREHMGPFGIPVRVSRQSLDRWIAAWRRGGFDALLPASRQVTARTPAEILDMATALKRENPQRTAAQVVRILRTHLGWTPSESTVARLFTRLELTGPAAARPSVFSRFEAARPNDRWTGDALHGPKVAGRKTYLFAFVDDHSRAVMGHRFGYAEDTVRLAAALRPALAARGVPSAVYVDYADRLVMPTLATDVRSGEGRRVEVSAYSEGFEEGQDWVGWLEAAGFGVGWPGPRERAFLLGHVSVQVDLCGGGLLVAKP
jgi:putative transposase